MINILQVVPILSYGGVERVVQNYYSVINKNEFHFDYVSHGEFVDYNEEILNKGSKIYFLSTIGKMGFSNYKKEIENKINLKKYDIIHIHTGDITGLYAKAYREVGARKIICHAHTAHPVSRIAKIFKFYFKYLACKYSDLRIGCGILAGNYCFGKENYTLLPNSIEYEKFMYVTENKKNKMKQKLGISEEKIIFGHVGSFYFAKNHDFLIDIFYEMCKNKNNYVLLLVGEGPDRKKYENKVKNLNLQNKVIFLGNRKDVNLLMNIFDIFLFPSFFEGLPVSVVEAQAAGLKCFISDRIDKTVDLEIGLVDFIPINKGVKCWSDKIENYFSMNEILIDNKKITKAIKEKGYDSKKSVLKLSKIYKSLYLEK